MSTPATAAALSSSPPTLPAEVLADAMEMISLQPQRARYPILHTVGLKEVFSFKKAYDEFRRAHPDAPVPKFHALLGPAVLTVLTASLGRTAIGATEKEFFAQLFATVRPTEPTAIYSAVGELAPFVATSPLWPAVVVYLDNFLRACDVLDVTEDASLRALCLSALQASPIHSSLSCSVFFQGPSADFSQFKATLW